MAQGTAQKTGRNAPCPCGSGRKYKKCCLNKSYQPNIEVPPRELASGHAQERPSVFSNNSRGDNTLPDFTAILFCLENPGGPFSERYGIGFGPGRGPEISLPEILEDLERQLVQRAYDKTGGVKTETARLLGIKTSALYYKLEKYGIGVIAGQKAGTDAPLPGADDPPPTGPQK